ncbi:hypothetical protein ACOMHN_009833 [Nucella lapillus]
MLALLVVAVLVCLGGSWAQVPSHCVTPSQFTGRSTQFDHETNQINRYFIAYDALNKRRAFIEEQNAVIPGKQFLEFLMLGNENVMYEINLSKKTCRKSPMRRPWRPFGIPPNATFESEYYIGGPGEQLFAQEWSDRIPLRQREYWLGVFSMKNCYPIREVFIADYKELNSTTTNNIFDIVEGIIDPNIFIPPPECRTAKWVPQLTRVGPTL